MKAWPLFLVLLALAATTRHSAWALQYRSDAYDLAVDLPESWNVCLDEAPAANHGFVVRLDSGQCEDLPRGAGVTFVVSYNVAFEYPSTPAMARPICGEAQARWSGLRLAGAALMRCSLPTNGGMARVLHFGLRARQGDAEAPSTDIAITAQCPAERMAKCLDIVAAIARSARGLAE